MAPAPMGVRTCAATAFLPGGSGLCPFLSFRFYVETASHQVRYSGQQIGARGPVLGTFAAGTCQAGAQTRAQGRMPARSPRLLRAEGEC